MPRVLCATIFSPRGGSAHVIRSLGRALPEHGWHPTILSGSAPGAGDAAAFYAGLDVRAVDFAAALRAPDPMRADPPMHPSYEDRPGAPDRVFARLDSDDYERQVRAWQRALQAAEAAQYDVLHVHHLTPIHEAAARVAPGVPVIGHLHGTELLMLEEIADGPPDGWEHAEAWARRMRGWAARCDRVLLLDDGQLQRSRRLLDLDPARCRVVPNGFDPSRFVPHEIDRATHWRRHLVESPRGWRPDAGAGSVAYQPADLAAFSAGAPVLLYVGRFTRVKRLGVLIRAYARAQPHFAVRAPLVLLGGHPGESEDEHPFDAVAAAGARDVFLAGWHEHDALPDFFAASDAVVLASVREQFGQVLVEGMACGLPAVAVDRHGPARIVRDGETGWLVEPDDEAGLAAALIDVVNDPRERARRGGAARTDVAERYAWPALAGRVAATYDEARRARGRVRAVSVPADESKNDPPARRSRA